MMKFNKHYKLQIFVLLLVLLSASFLYIKHTQAGAIVSLYSNLNSAADVTSPEIGPPGVVNNGVDYVDGYDGGAIHFDSSVAGESVAFGGAGTFDSDSNGIYDTEGMATFWFKPDSDMGTWYGKLFDTTGTTTRFTLYAEANHLRIYMRAGATVLGYFNTSDLTWQAGTWHHIRFWYKGDLATDNVRLWVDGVEVLANHNGTFAFPGSASFTVGNGQGGLAPANGAIDDLKIYTSNDGIPAISSLSDNVISSGEQITISGTNFGDNVGGGGSISFQGTAGTISSWSDTSIVVTAPETFVDGQITVTSYYGTSGGIAYTLAAGINNIYYASTRQTLLITGGGFGLTQDTSNIYLDNIDQGSADYWDANQIYLTGVSSIPSSVKLEVGVDEIVSSSITNLPLYSPYPFDSDTENEHLISYWPFDTNWEDVKGTNDGTNRSTLLRPDSIFNKSLQTSQMVSFEDLRYVAFGGLIKLENGDILEFARNAETHFFTESKIEMRRSTDGGFTWTDPEVVIDNIGFDDRMDGDSLLQLPNGDIIFCYGKLNVVGGGDYDTPIMASTDNGETWSQRATLMYGDFGLYGALSRIGKPLLLESGRIIVPTTSDSYPGDVNTHISIYSDDSGYTWEIGGTIASQPDSWDEIPKATLTAPYTAGSSEMTVNDVSNFPDAGVMRIDDGVNTEAFTYGYKEGNILKNIYRGTTVTVGLVNSYAAGTTAAYNPKEINESQMIKAPDDSCLITFLRINDPNYRMMYSYSYDQGMTWTQPKAMYFGPTGQVLYGQAFRLHTDSNGRIYMFYRHDGYMLTYSDDNGVTWSGTNSIVKNEGNAYLFNNSAGGYASVIEKDDYLLMQLYKEYNSGDNAFIEKTVLYKNDPIGNFGNFVGVPSSASLQLNQFSIDFWFRLDDHWDNSVYGEEQTILAKRDATELSKNNVNYEFLVQDPLDGNADKLQFGLTDATNTYRSVHSNATIDSGRWYHATGSYDGTAIKLYLDGMIQESLDTTLTTLESSPLNIGIYSVQLGNKFRGQVDNIKIWDTALANYEILSDSNYSLPYIDSVSPTSADRSTNLTIAGYNFGSSQNDSIVTIGSDEMTIVSWSDDEIVATIPAGAAKGTENLFITVAGNESNTASIIVGIDPIISDVQLVSFGQNSATISWTTDEPANSQVFYGTTQILNMSSTDASLSTSHEIDLSSLDAGTMYYYKVSSTDSDGNSSISDDFMTFTTIEDNPPDDDSSPADDSQSADITNTLVDSISQTQNPIASSTLANKNLDIVGELDETDETMEALPNEIGIGGTEDFDNPKPSWSKCFYIYLLISFLGLVAGYIVYKLSTKK